MQIAAAAAAPETTTAVGGHWHRESGECEREFRNAINLVAVCHGKAAHATAKHSEDCGALRCRFRGKAMDPLVAEETSSKWRMERKKGTINCTRRLQCSSFSAVQRGKFGSSRRFEQFRTVRGRLWSALSGQPRRCKLGLKLLEALQINRSDVIC